MHAVRVQDREGVDLIGVAVVELDRDDGRARNRRARLGRRAAEGEQPGNGYERGD
jgi:hypothetical protein